jgi:hypothetical protein
MRADARKGDIGIQLGEIAKANPEVAIGSYPFFDQQQGPNTNVVLRCSNAHLSSSWHAHVDADITVPVAILDEVPEPNVHDGPISMS